MDTCISLFQKEQEDRAYRLYVSECLRHISENTAKTASAMLGKDAEAKYINVSFEEMIHPKPAETRTPEEIISHIKKELQNLGGE